VRSERCNSITNDMTGVYGPSALRTVCSRLDRGTIVQKMHVSCPTFKRWHSYSEGSLSLCIPLTPSLCHSLSLPLSLTFFLFMCQSACISLILSLFFSLCPLSESLSCSLPLILLRHIYICTHLHLQSWSFLGVQGNGDVEVLKRFARVTKCAMDLTYSTATGCVC
jgi:hypothetical protein